MHLDSVDELIGWASEAITNCAAADFNMRNQIRARPVSVNHNQDNLIIKMTSRTCMVIGILLNSTMRRLITLNDYWIHEVRNLDKARPFGDESRSR